MAAETKPMCNELCNFMNVSVEAEGECWEVSFCSCGVVVTECPDQQAVEDARMSVMSVFSVISKNSQISPRSVSVLSNLGLDNQITMVEAAQLLDVPVRDVVAGVFLKKIDSRFCEETKLFWMNKRDAIRWFLKRNESE